MQILTSAIVAIIVSAIYCKISAANTFSVIDGYVKDMIELAKKSIGDAYLNK